MSGVGKAFSGGCADSGGSGNDWRVGTGAPSIVAGDNEGDLYLDEANGDVYQVQSSVWALVANIKGPQGDQGDTGAAGADGSDWRVAAGAPSIIAGDEEGDLYLNTTNGDVYQVQSAAWVLVANIIGPQGDQGDQGIQGDQGDQGIQGDQGEAGAPHTGLSSGGLLAVDTDTTKFDVSAGSGDVVNNYTTPGTPAITPVSWTAFDAVTVTNLATQDRTYVAIDSAGLIVQQGTNWTIEERRDLIVLGLLVHPNRTSIQATGGFVITTWDLPLQLVDFVQAVGPMNVTGNVVSANGVNLNIDRSAGQQYRLGGNYDTDAQNPSVVASTGDTALTFRYRYRDGSGGITEGANTTVIDPANYDDNSGTPATITGSNKWSVHRIWAFASGTVRIMYGQNTYKNLAEAEASLIGAVFDADPNLLSNGVLRSWLIIKNDATDLTDTSKAKFIEADKFGHTPSGGVSSSTTTLQQAYNNSDVEPEITVSASSGAVSIRDAATPIGANLLEVQDNAGSVDFLAVDADGVIVDGTLRLKERAASLADIAARGQLWVKNTTPNELWFTDDAGTDHQISNVVPTGGTAGQYLAKVSGTDFDTEWRTFHSPKVMSYIIGTGTPTIGTTLLQVPATFVVDTDPGSYTLNSTNDYFSVAEDGTYKLSCCITLDTSSSNVARSRVVTQIKFQRLEVGVGVWNDIIPLHRQSWDDVVFRDDIVHHFDLPIVLNATDRIRIIATKFSGADTIVCNEANSLVWVERLQAAGDLT